MFLEIFTVKAFYLPLKVDRRFFDSRMKGRRPIYKHIAAMKKRMVMMIPMNIFELGWF